jgi:hypothetical protein
MCLPFAATRPGAGLGPLPGHEEPRLAREDEATLRPLQVEYALFEPMSGDHHVALSWGNTTPVARVDSSGRPPLDAEEKHR